MAEASKDAFEPALKAKGFGSITTEIIGPKSPNFPSLKYYLAEEYHQQCMILSIFYYRRIRIVIFSYMQVYNRSKSTSVPLYKMTLVYISLCLTILYIISYVLLSVI